MTIRTMMALFAFLASTAGCHAQTSTGTRNGEVVDHWQYRQFTYEVAMALDAPDGADFPRAIEIYRKSDLTLAEKGYEIGSLIVSSFDKNEDIRTPYSISQGLQLLENAARDPGLANRYVAESLRLIFEQGVGTAPVGIPIDTQVAKCWFGLTRGGKGDPDRCIALRRERLPQLNVPPGTPPVRLTVD